jgi:hypothetical protein
MLVSNNTAKRTIRAVGKRYVSHLKVSYSKEASAHSVGVFFLSASMV